jgi:uncharacterized protein YrrD
MENEDPVSWRAVTAHCPVIASDGHEIGTVLDVAALPQKDIFHGIVFRRISDHKTVVAPASDVQNLTTRAVYLSVASEAASEYEAFHPTVVERLGLRGHFLWKHIGWNESNE